MQTRCKFLFSIRDPHKCFSRQTMVGTLEFDLVPSYLEGMLAITLSAKKRIRQNLKRRARNRRITTRMRTNIKIAKQSIADADVSKAEEAVPKAISSLDWAVSKGVLHPNNGARRKSRLLARYKELKNKS